MRYRFGRRKGRIMGQKDVFQEIADNRVQVTEEQHEIAPRLKNDRLFQKSDTPFPYEEVYFGQEISFETRKKEFYRELAELREKYRPFMTNNLPDWKTETEVTELRHFSFRYQEKGEVFTDRNRTDAVWEEVTLPDYRGPAGENGKWTGYYRTCFFCRKTGRKERIVLQFQSVDYVARVYVNGCFVGSHEGLFAPFSFDVSDYVHPEEDNELIVECHNDIPMMGVGDLLDGDKLYAATGPGWDDPETGWHHCPAGAGITGKVTLEYRPCIFLEDVFVCPDIDADVAQVRVGVRNYTDELQRDYKLRLRLLPKNFRGEAIAEYVHPVPYIGVGQNEYRFVIDIKDYRLWEPEKPWLYGILLELSPAEQGGKEPESQKASDTEGEEQKLSNMACISRLAETVGIRKFVSDENSNPKGKFFLNNRPIVLRGANEMGHLQQCVMNRDWDLLTDDILIAKLCNMNYYRITQRPVQREIYDYFDMLGMMHQCDLPLFSFMRRPQFAEGVRQCVEMEHLIRNHPSSIMVTFINEPMTIKKTQDPKSKGSVRSVTKGHRHLMRDELEAFFVAARQAIYTENPGRVIKNAEGDYEPPTVEGMPDFHCYTMWYSHHAMPIGKLLAGYLPAVKSGWMTGCGEYGAEGLDNLHVMKTRYPEEWLALDEKGHWYPDKIVRAQTHSLQGDWYPEQHTMEDWIRESQRFQAKATTMMTDAFRRRADVISHTAIHLLIDAWPAGWMKTLVDCEREPKRAYFAYRDSLVPVRMNFYSPRAYVYGGEKISVEVWLLNDSGEDRELLVQAAFACLGTLEITMPVVEKVTSVTLDGCVRDVTADFAGKSFSANRESRHGGEQSVQMPHAGKLYGEKLGFTVYPAKGRLCPESLRENVTEGECADWVILPLLTAQNRKTLEASIERITAEGKTAVLCWGADKNVAVTVQGERVGLKKCQEVFFAAADEDYRKYSPDMLYDERKGYIDVLTGFCVDTVLTGKNRVYTYARNGFDDGRSEKKKLPFVLEIPVGNGKLLAVSLETEGRICVNANLDALLRGY